MFRAIEGSVAEKRWENMTVNRTRVVTQLWNISSTILNGENETVYSLE